MSRVLRLTCCGAGSAWTQFSECADLQNISTGGSTEHVVIFGSDLHTVHYSFQLAKVAVSGHNLTSLWTQFPHTQSVTECGRKVGEVIGDAAITIVRLYLLSPCHKQVISSVAESKCIDRSSTLHGCLTSADCLLLLQIPNHNTSIGLNSNSHTLTVPDTSPVVILPPK